MYRRIYYWNGNIPRNSPQYCGGLSNFVGIIWSRLFSLVPPIMLFSLVCGFSMLHHLLSLACWAHVYLLGWNKCKVWDGSCCISVSTSGSSSIFLLVKNSLMSVFFNFCFFAAGVPRSCFLFSVLLLTGSGSCSCPSPMMALPWLFAMARNIT